MKQELRYTDKKGNKHSAYIPKKNPLPTRERQILILSNQGLSAKQVGEALELTVNTVNTNKKRIFKRLKCHTTKQAVIVAIEKGYIEND